MHLSVRIEVAKPIRVVEVGSSEDPMCCAKKRLLMTFSVGGSDWRSRMRMESWVEKQTVLSSKMKLVAMAS